jgi:putative YpdA family bacillithiol system oxidoreductase
MAIHDVIVVGAGPAGLSAAVHAQKNGLDVLLLEKGELANTIFEYQKGKHVMAEPGMVPLRSDVAFQAGTREFLLETWQRAAQESGLSIRRPEAVTEISPSPSDRLFTIKTDKSQYQAKHVILAIGIQGNPRNMNAPGEDLPHVSRRLADPTIYENEDIVMVGAGDAAIEGVLALCEKNRVSVVNRSEEFFRLKEALDREINQRIAAGQVTAYHKAAVERVEEGYAHIKMPDRTVKVKAGLVFLRIGSEPPKGFLKKIGVQFASDDPMAPPVLSEHCETTIPGLYMIGAVSGQHLIKQGMNQGYDVIEHILGHPIEPVVVPIIREKLHMLQGTLDERLAAIISAVPLVSQISKTSLMEVLLESKVHEVPSGQVIFREHDYSDSFYQIVRGSVAITFEAQMRGDAPITLNTGEFFGEVSLLSGRRRSGTVTADQSCVLIETPRKGMLRLMSQEPSVKRAIDESFIVRAMRTYLLPQAEASFLREVASKALMKTFKQGEVVFRQGDIGDAFYLVRTGSVKVSKHSGVSGDKDVVVSYVPSGRYFGEMALLNPDNPRRTATITATKQTDTIVLKKEDFETILTHYPAFAREMKDNVQKSLIHGQQVALREIVGGDTLNRMLDEGVFEGTDVLLIDENKCIRCDQCVKACADTHEGQTRLYRTEGIIFANLLVPTSCRHCENPMCLSDCLAGDAILRDPSGEVFIKDNCIGCGNCAKNCPYGNIHMMHKTMQKELGALDRLLGMLGLGPKPGVHDEGPTKAVKCDLCRSDEHGPACVRSCPTGAAFRVSPEEYFKKVGVGAL